MTQKHIKLIPGKIIAAQKLAALKSFISGNSSPAVKPRLEIFQLGSDPASTIYTDLKAQKAAEVGIDARVRRFVDGNLAGLLQAIAEANQNQDIHGVMLQSPLPHVEWTRGREVFASIAAAKDVDALTPESLGQIWQQKSLSEIFANPKGYISATPLGVLDCLQWIAGREGQSLADYLSGKDVLIINRSNIVGKPLAALMLAGDATVKMAHSATRNLTAQLQQADIILTATGVRGLLKLADLAPGQVVIDIGINKKPGIEGVTGDVDLAGYEDFSGLENLTVDKKEAKAIGSGESTLTGESTLSGELVQATSSGDSKNKALYIAAVPGGVGPLTIVNLLQNTLLSYSRVRLGKSSYQELTLAMVSNYENPSYRSKPGTQAN